MIINVPISFFTIQVDSKWIDENENITYKVDMKKDSTLYFDFKGNYVDNIYSTDSSFELSSIEINKIIKKYL